MARRGLNWYLFSAAGKPMYVDNMGFIKEGTENYLTLEGQDARLEFSPVGWKDTLVKYGRNIKYWGLQRDFTVPMMFPRDGMKILKTVLWAQGYEGKCFLGATKLNRVDLPYKYESWYLSEINFTKYKQFKTYVEVEALEGGMSKIFKAFENTVFEINIDDQPDVQNVLLDGIEFLNAQEYSFLDGVEFGGGTPFTDDLTIGMVKKNPDGVSPYVTLYDQFIDVADGPDSGNIYDYLIGSSNYFLKLTEDAPDTPIHLTGKIDIDLVKQRDNNGLIYVRFWNVKKDYVVGDLNTGLAIEVFKGYIYGPEPKYKRFVDGVFINEITFDVTINMQKGDRVFYTIEYIPFDSSDKSSFTVKDTSTLSVDYKSRYQPTYAKGLYPLSVFRELVKKMIDGQLLIDNGTVGDRWKSDWLTGKKDLLITSGDALRRFEGSVIKTSISEFFQSMNFYGCSLGVEKEKLFIELFNYVFNDEIIIDLGEVSDANFEVADDLLFNTISTGGPEIDYEDTNGRFEFNQSQKWKSINTRAVKDLDISSKYRKDSYGIEYARINLDGKKSTDDSGDNDVFMINVEPNINVVDDFNYHKLNRPAYTIYTGAPPTSFNSELTPHIGILNNGAFIRSVFFREDATDLTLTYATKNKDLKTVLIRTVEEKANINIGSLPDSLFLPFYISFTTSVPVNLLSTLNRNPYGKVKFRVQGRSFTGFLMDGGVKPSMNDKQQWKLLSCKENDLSLFYE